MKKHEKCASLKKPRNCPMRQLVSPQLLTPHQINSGNISSFIIEKVSK